MLGMIASLWKRFASLRRDDEGFVVMATLSIFLFLFVLCASIYAIGETVRTRIKLQNACDAAAYSAAVVQADGLSRMATINRAMSWTYVHMTNMQMDYITYRWLRLTAKRFIEDYDNAREYHKYIVTSFDPKLGWWAILEVAFDAYTSRLFGCKCNYRHDKEGIGWWCGSGPNTSHNIRFNGHRDRGNPQSYESIQKVLAGMSHIMDKSATGNGDLIGKNTDDDGEKDVDVEYGLDAKVGEVESDYAAQIAALDTNDPDYEKKKANLEDARDRKIDELEKEAEEYAREQSDAAVQTGNAHYSNDPQIKAINDKYDSLIANNPEQRDALNALRQQELSQIAASRGGSSDDVSGSVASVGVNGTWGNYIGELIDADKKNIQLMNAMLVAVNENMYESMKTTAQFVLASMLKDPRMASDRALKNYSAYFYIPRGSNPYQMGDNGSEGDQAANFFSPLYNTEPCERLFLHMNSPEHASDPLYALFPLDGNPANADLKGWGLDQWFVRGGRNQASMPVTVRTEGALGIQRCYKDANINETGAGVELLKRYVSRGNHIANLTLENSDRGNTSKTTTSLSGSIPGDYENLQWVLKSNAKKHHTYVAEGDENIFKKMVNGILSKAGQSFSSILSSFKGGLTDQFCDITPSAGNASSDKFFAMCPKSSNTVALYADYDWSSAKWICLNRATFATMWLDYLLCKILTGKCHNKLFFCNWGTCTHKKKKLGVTIAKYKHKGWGHYHFPKWFCGMKPKFQGNVSLGISDSVAKWTLFDLLPPVLPEDIRGNLHGYMDNTIRWDDFFIPSKPLFLRESCSLDNTISPYHGRDCVLDKSRPDYRGCACFFDGSLTAWNYKGQSGYSGPSSQQTTVKAGDILKVTTRHPQRTIPIVSDNKGPVEETMDGENSSFKPVAGFINGHARVYGDDKEIFDDRYIGEKCEPWVLNERFFNGLGTVVIGIALKHSNPFVQLYNFWGSDEEDVSEHSVLSAFDPPSSGLKYQGRTLGHNYMWTMSAARAGVRRLRRGGEMDGERKYQVVYDASSDAHNLNYGKGGAHYFKDNEWKPGFPDVADDPKIMAGCVCDGNPKQFKEMWNLCEQDWDATLLPLRYAGRGAEVVDASKSIWKWKETAGRATDVGNENPLNPADQSTSWRPLDSDSDHMLNLKSMMPGNECQLKLDELLKNNKVL